MDPKVWQVMAYSRAQGTCYPILEKLCLGLPLEGKPSKRGRPPHNACCSGTGHAVDLGSGKVAKLCLGKAGQS